MAALRPSSSSRTTRSSSANRIRGPLVEIPLDQFLLPTSASNATSRLGSSTKRPVSPGTPVLYSPAKRRILTEEGLFAAKSPLLTSISAASTVASSSNSFKTPQHYQQQYQQNMTKFADALTGPDSPARKLDFGMPKDAAAGGRTPSRDSEVQDKALAPSPEIKSIRHSRLRSPELDDDYFSSSSSQLQSQPPQSQSQPSSSSSGSASQSQRQFDFTPVPREPPLPPDPQSIHYPGFNVYQDTHILVPSISLTSPTPASATSTVLVPLQAQPGADFPMEFESIDARELVKENLAPRRKSCKAATTPLPERPQLFSPPSAKSPSLPATPPGIMARDKELLTPRRLSIFGAGVVAGLATAQHAPSHEKREMMRRILEEEVNGEQGDD